LLVVTQNGYGKRTPLSSYPVKGRGIGGVRAIKTTPKTGPVAAARVVQGFEELMMISAGGIVIRTPLEMISERAGRATSGVILMNLRDGDRLAAIAILEPTPNGNGDGDHHDEEGGDVLTDEQDEAVMGAIPTAAETEETVEDDADESDTDAQDESAKD
jgi:DNA gyrase subunit A